MDRENQSSNGSEGQRESISGLSESHIQEKLRWLEECWNNRPDVVAEAGTSAPSQDAGSGSRDEYQPDTWNPAKQQYSVRGLLHIRELMHQKGSLEKPPEMLHIKFLIMPGLGAAPPEVAPKKHEKKAKATKTQSKRQQKESAAAAAAAAAEAPLASAKAVAAAPAAPAASEDTPDPLPLAPQNSKASRNVPEMGTTQIVPGSAQGQWWRVLPVAQVIVRESLDLTSTVVFTVKPGHYIQQAGNVEIFVSGQASGLQRMPVYVGSNKTGWATVDATAVGGPRYLEKVKSPRWKVIFRGDKDKGDIVVRRHASLDSEAVGVLMKGTEVEQSGPQEIVDGIIRMPVVFRSDDNIHASIRPDGSGGGLKPSDAELASGWVTCDASAQGGPEFFKSVDSQQSMGHEQQDTEASAEIKQQLEAASASLPCEESRSAVVTEAPETGAADEEAQLPAGSWSKNRVWRVQNVEDQHSLPILSQAEPHVPNSGHKRRVRSGILRYLQNGDLVEQVGHSRKMRGYMVMPVRFLGQARGSDIDELINNPHQEKEGWLTRRSLERSRDALPWVEELVKESSGEWIARKPRGAADD